MMMRRDFYHLLLGDGQVAHQRHWVEVNAQLLEDGMGLLAQLSPVDEVP
jgi:hypothetical protein